MDSAKKIIEKLKLKPHPEGGYFNEYYRSSETIEDNSLPLRFSGDRNISTSIYFLLEGNQVSLFHRLKSDEIWHYYKGSAAILHCLEENGNYFTIRIGNNIEQNEQPQFVISNGIWFAAEIVDKDSYSLVGCTVAPGFDFADFELANQKKLIEKFPLYKELILRFSKETY